jgi:hypothetical protein
MQQPEYRPHARCEREEGRWRGQQASGFRSQGSSCDGLEIVNGIGHFYREITDSVSDRNRSTGTP